MCGKNILPVHGCQTSALTRIHNENVQIIHGPIRLDVDETSSEVFNIVIG